MFKKLQIFLILLPSLLFSQSTGYQSGSASANLIMPLSIESGSGNLDFGDILISGNSKKETIRPKNGKEFIVRGQSNRNISVVFSKVELNNHVWVSNNSGESSTLIFTPDVQLENSSKIKSGDDLILQPNGLIGEVKFNVGGSIKVGGNQPEGDYEGLFVISVSY